MKKIITIDGGVATGKTTISKQLSKDLKINFLPTGKLYRMVALIYSKNNLNIENLIEFIQNNKITFLNDQEIFKIDNFSYEEKELHLVNKKELFEISQNNKIRKILTNVFRDIVSNSNNDFIVEGRDAATNIFPNSKYKFFLKVSDEIAAKRRQKELNNMGIDLDFSVVLNEIKDRNNKDSNRKTNPLIIPQDSKIILTDNLSIEKIIERIKNEINKI